ncbi:MAG: response regulator [Snowella sp.]|nr:response regulator [Snowella sp.]
MNTTAVNETSYLPNTPIQEMPYKVLQKFVEDKVSGKLIIQNPFDEYVRWQVYLGNGKIHVANSGVGSSERLNYLLGNHLNNRDITLPPQLTDDYQYICNLWKKEIFSFQQTRSILTQCTQEALIQVLSLPKTRCYLDTKDKLDQLFLNLDFEQITSPIQHKIRYWWQLRSEINSPFQRPLVENWGKLQKVLAKNYFEGKNGFTQLSQGLENLHCLYKIGNLTGLSTLQLALMLRPLIKSGDIKMLSYQDIEEDTRPSVLYIGDRPPMQRMINFTLEKSGFKALNIADPLKALAVMLSQQPDMVLIDAEMPDINGYQLCSLCRKTDAMKNLPIILLGDEDSLVYRIKAKLSGASDYIKKPFLPQELVKIIKSHLVGNTLALKAS